jgi:hypothetical protein
MNTLIRQSPDARQIDKQEICLSLASLANSDSNLTMVFIELSRLICREPEANQILQVQDWSA